MTTDGDSGSRPGLVTDQALRDEVLPGLAALLDALPEIPPEGTSEAGAYAYAHGFYCRSARTAQAALTLVDAGFASEAAPLRRALLEHVLALTWVIDEGEAAVASLTRVHQERMRRIKDLMDNRWPLRDEDFDQLLSQDIPSSGQDHLAQYGQLVKRYDSSSDLLIAWLSDTGESHPSYLTASAYWHAEGTRLATTPEGRARTDLQAIGLLWWIASCEMSRVIAWENTLREIGGRAGLQIMRVSS